MQEGYAFVISRLREQTEFAAAMGGLVFKPYMDGGRIAIDFVHADRFIPTAYNSRGEVTGAVFVERVKKGRAWYTRLESHQLTDTGYAVQNKAFISYQEGELGVPATLTSVDEWADLEENLVMGYRNGDTLERPLFVYFKMPFANHIDAESPLGVSVCARAAGLMEQATGNTAVSYGNLKVRSWQWMPLSGHCRRMGKGCLSASRDCSAL